MMQLLRVAALAAFCVSATAQVTEIPQMTVGTSVIDMDTASLGASGAVTTIAALRTAGTNGGAPLADLRLVPNLAAQGYYNTNPELGRALGRRASDNGLQLIAPYNTFEPFDAEIALDFPSTQFGIAVGDWIGSMVLEFYYLGNLVGSITSSPYATADAKFFQSVAFFDLIKVRADTVSANWVIPQLHFQSAGPWRLYGSGCAGSNGVPQLSLVSLPRVGNVYSYAVSNLPPASGFFVNIFGLSSTTADVGGTAVTLPYSLSTFGAPGCFALCDLAITTYEFAPGSTATFSTLIPNEPSLANVTFFNQVYPFDQNYNSLNFTSSRGARVIILDASAP